MLNTGIALIVVACTLATYFLVKGIIYLKTLDEQIVSLWKNGYSCARIANKLDTSVDYVDAVISRVIFHQ
jgi:hypothetical protein